MDTNMATAVTGAEEEEKTFTQEEVNTLIEKRLAKERKRSSRTSTGSLDDREREISKRELKATMHEQLNALELPKEILDILDYTDEESAYDSLESIKKIINTEVDKRVKQRQSIAGGKTLTKGSNNLESQIHNAFKRNN